VIRPSVVHMAQRRLTRQALVQHVMKSSGDQASSMHKMPYPTSLPNLTATNTLYHPPYLTFPHQKVSSFTDHTQCDGHPADPATNDLNVQLYSSLSEL